MVYDNLSCYLNAILASALHDQDSDVRSYAAYTLGKMGEKAATPDIIQSLASALHDQDSYVRSRAADALEKLEVRIFSKQEIYISRRVADLARIE